MLHFTGTIIWRPRAKTKYIVGRHQGARSKEEGTHIAGYVNSFKLCRLVYVVGPYEGRRRLCCDFNFRGQSRVVIKRPHCNNEDVGLNPTTTRNENQTLGGPLQKVAQGSEQDLSGRPAMLKLN